VPVNLLADCANCFGLCCVALPFAASADFAVSKPGGEPCVNLQADYRCGIHTELRDRGYKGCTVFDCFGAGQKISQGTFGGRSWRESRDTAEAMFGTFPVMRQLHELLWYLTEALALPTTAVIHAELREALTATELLAEGSAEELRELDVAAHRGTVNALLLRTAELVRHDLLGKAAVPKRKNFRGADLMGAKLARADLQGASLRGTYLIGADLAQADLSGADMIGADLRGTNLKGANLARALFLTQGQVNAAIGDADTRIPRSLTHPAHWAAAAPPVADLDAPTKVTACPER
jgi:hypothetical protein